MNRLNFSDDKYKNLALNIKYNNMNVCSYIDSVFILINGLDYEALSILCDKIYEKLNINDDSITCLQCYEMTQNLDLNIEFKKVIVEIFNKCIEDGMYLGTKISSKYNTSAWINHSYYVSMCSMKLALILGLNPEKARVYGLLHDYGRKNDSSLNHIISGFQELYDLGYKDEAVACLTHSFLNGDRCSNNEKALEGFYVDKDGIAKWMEDAILDDVKRFLDGYQYNDYDRILNIADLMATGKGILEPYDRILDIAKRREIDITNRGYFLANLTNTLIDILKRIDIKNNDMNYIYAKEDVDLSQIEDYFKKISTYFYVVYKQLSKE